MIEGAGNNSVLVGKFLACRCEIVGERLDVTNDPGHMSDAMVPPVFLAVPSDNSFEKVSSRRDMSLPGDLEVKDVVAHGCSLSPFVRRRVWHTLEVAILIDDPIWWHRERRWCHMISDESIGELIAFADAVGVPRRGFEGDHYDIPEEYRSDMVAAGAAEVGSRELLRRMKTAGLRLSAMERREFFAVRKCEGPDAAIALVISSFGVGERAGAVDG